MQGQGGDGRTNERTNKRKSPCVLQDFVPFRAAAQKRKLKISLLWASVLGRTKAQSNDREKASFSLDLCECALWSFSLFIVIQHLWVIARVPYGGGCLDSWHDILSIWSKIWNYGSWMYATMLPNSHRLQFFDATDISSHAYLINLQLFTLQRWYRLWEVFNLCSSQSFKSMVADNFSSEGYYVASSECGCNKNCSMAPSLSQRLIDNSLIISIQCNVIIMFVGISVCS